MDRIVRYARAEDGTRVASWTLGTGRPLLYLAGGPWNHIEIWDVPQCRAWSERLAQKRTLVRYDVRGTGLSGRETTDFSLDAHLSDLEAVVRELGLDQFDLFAAGDAGPVAISYAVRHPAHVSRIVLWCAWAKGSDFEISPRIQAWRGLIDQDWDLMSETCAHLAFGWDAGAIGRRAAESFKASITRETAQMALEATVSFDVTGLLPRLEQPTLVIHRNAVSWLPAEIALALASNIPNSRLAIIPGETTAPYLGDSESIASLIDEFLDGPGIDAGEEAAEPSPAVGTAAALRPSVRVSAAQRNTGVVEVLPLVLRDDRILRCESGDLAPWEAAFDPSLHPGEVARAELARRGLLPVVVHSTSWRMDRDRLVLTYVAVLDDPGVSAGFREAHVQPRDLARGTATTAPEQIQTGEVVEHALRHLAWLAREDEPVREALGPVWQKALRAYEPEPFSAFDLSGALSEEDGCLLSTRYSRPLSQFVAGETAAG